MAKENNLKDFLTDVADAIREKEGSTGLINPQEFSAKIRAIETGGGGETPTPDMPVIGDGKTYLYIKIAEKGRMVVPLYFSQTIANGVTIDWGDGATQTLSGTGNQNTTHTYAEIGEYTISLNPSSGCTLTLGHGSSSSCVMGSTSDSATVNFTKLQCVEIGNNVSIAKYAFSSCYSLTSVVISQGVTSIGSYAFYECYSLTSVVISQGVTSIGSYAFRDCYSLTSIVIPQGVTSIGDYAFTDCKTLTSVVIPQGVTSIGSYAFGGCYSLTSIVIPQGVTSIGTYAFNKCYSLTSAVIPQGVTSIDANAFNSCYSLTSVVIPQGVTSIGSNAFYSCYGMAYFDLTRCTSVPTLASTSTLKNIPSDCKIVVPDDLYDTWIATTNWSTYANNIIKASEFNA